MLVPLPSRDVCRPFPLRVTLNIRRGGVPCGAFPVGHGDLVTKLLFSLSTVFSTTFERRLTRLGGGEVCWGRSSACVSEKAGDAESPTSADNCGLMGWPPLEMTDTLAMVVADSKDRPAQESPVTVARLRFPNAAATDIGTLRPSVRTTCLARLLVQPSLLSVCIIAPHKAWLPVSLRSLAPNRNLRNSA